MLVLEVPARCAAVRRRRLREVARVARVELRVEEREHDLLVNRQRVVIYEQRRAVLEGEDMKEQVLEWINEVVERTVDQFTSEEYAEEWDLEGLVKQMALLYDTEVTVDELREDLGDVTRDSLVEEFSDDARDAYAAKEEELTPDLMRELERFVILQVVDQRWREHLDSMDYLREGVHLRAMAQKDPLVEYQHEGHLMFGELGLAIHEEVVLTLFHAQLDPSKWSILGGGDVDGGRGAYVHAKSLDDGSNSTFLLEHDDGLAPYQAFLLHEKTLAAAQASSPVPVRVESGDLCSAAALTRAEQIAMVTLSAGFAQGTPPDASKQAVDNATQAAFADAPCRGLEYAGEQARLVYAGVQPRSQLMPGAR